MTLSLNRGLALIEQLCGQPEGMSLTALADELDIPRSACHRLLLELQKRGYVRQKQSQGNYLITVKIASIGLEFLSSKGIVDIAEPILEDLRKNPVSWFVCQSWMMTAWSGLRSRRAHAWDFVMTLTWEWMRVCPVQPLAMPGC